MTTPSCSLCAGPAVYLDRVTGEHLCGVHLAARVEEVFRSTFRGPGGLSANERVAVAFSGGKDSSVLLHLLATVAAPELGLSLVALTIDEGIDRYREETVRAARALAARLGVEHRIVGFGDACGASLDDLVAGRAARACTICGILRRRLLQQAARDLGADRLATGHCLDDEAESIVMNWLRGDLYRSAGVRPAGGAGMVPRTKPLARLLEKEVVLYGILHDLAPTLPECPYARHALRSGVRGMVHRAEHRWPGTMARVVAGQVALENRLRGQLPPARFTTCPACGEPVLGESCRACALLGRALENH
ncbi:MAG: TIGR00269 family protein [Methanospirillum sp.]|nr:TIGR00269 family protein [Methanospirillum sp.]